MIIPIISGVLSVIFIIGGLIPSYSNKKLEDIIKENFSSKKVNVETYSYPSFKILNGNFDRIEIVTVKSKIKNIDVDELKLIISPMNVDYKLIEESEDLSFIKNSYLEFMGSISNNTLQKYINSKDIKDKINDVLKLVDLNLPFNLDNFYLDNISISFENERLNVISSINGLAGFISVPFKLSLNLKVNNKNQIEFFDPQAEVFGHNVVFEKAKNLIEKLNPIYDINSLNQKNMRIKVNKIFFEKNKLKTIGSINFD